MTTADSCLQEKIYSNNTEQYQDTVLNKNTKVEEQQSKQISASSSAKKSSSRRSKKNSSEPETEKQGQKSDKEKKEKKKQKKKQQKSKSHTESSKVAKGRESEENFFKTDDESNSASSEDEPNSFDSPYEEDTDFVGDFEFIDEDEEFVKDFKCLTESDILLEQKRSVERVSELLSLKPSQAAVLLRNWRWKKEKLLSDYLEDSEKVLKSAGIIRKVLKSYKSGSSSPAHERTKSKKKKKKKKTSSKCRVQCDTMCSICGEDDLTSETAYALRCRHTFCRACWKQYLETKVNEGEATGITCPAVDCKNLLEERTIKRLVDRTIFAKYLASQMRSFVDANEHVKWCPAPGCGNAVNIDAVRDQTVMCSCGYRFCFRCGEESHLPCTCEQVAAWKKKSQDESETNNWINANTQACPKCSSHIEKNGGCNHMTCRSCGHEYCWLCLRDWKGHNDFYTCNRYLKAQSKKASDDKDKKNKKKSSGDRRDKALYIALQKAEHKALLERYLHFYGRFVNHNQSGHLEKIRETAQRKMAEWKENDGLVAEARFLERATEQLLECRRALKWSYALGYYLCDSDAKKNLFEYVQSDLEKTVEKLTEALESVPRVKKVEIVDITRLAETRYRSMLSWVNSVPQS